MSIGNDKLQPRNVPLPQYEAEIEALKKSFTHPKKRQEDGDDSYILIGQATNIERSGHRFMVDTPGPSGTEIEISEIESFGLEVGVSAEFRPSSTIGEIWVSINGNVGNFRVECLGAYAVVPVAKYW
ncbi:hypothetical protein D7B24_008173 [Verticillium nonalfalfae]|uniref:Uncharacterized protein n=1 Tax=Verticillium nonalfalfae TaxID=1051616 RepID=A0A3M9Y6F0_9PEZI|nr:uncharacterized protein D7B24_008173 [Verticillium nonalfalfae]RNJ55745.1 hypothetical protein D7B24_008173 [Verticillium nonalfalfae]